VDNPVAVVNDISEPAALAVPSDGLDAGGYRSLDQVGNF
jgi:hypothetical protein